MLETVLDSEQRIQQTYDLVAREHRQPRRGLVVSEVPQPAHGQERIGHHRQQRPPVPRPPQAHLMLVQPGQILALGEGLLDTPPAPGYGHQTGQRHHLGRIAAEEGMGLDPGSWTRG